MDKSANLKDWRKAKGWNQDALAGKLGSGQSTYQSWEAGRTSIPPDIQAKLRKLGYNGLWPKEEAKAAPLPPGTDYLTLEAFAEWRGYWKAGMEGILERIERLEAQIRKLSPPEERE